MYVLLIPWLPEMEAYMGASGKCDKKTGRAGFSLLIT